MKMRAALCAAALVVGAAPASAAVAVNGSAASFPGLGLGHAALNQSAADYAAHPAANGAMLARKSLRRLAGVMVGDVDGAPIKFTGLKLAGTDQDGIVASAPLVDAPLLPEIMLAASNPTLIANHAAVPADVVASGGAQIASSGAGPFSLMSFVALPLLPSISDEGNWGLMLLGFATLGAALRRTGDRTRISFS